MKRLKFLQLTDDSLVCNNCGGTFLIPPTPMDLTETLYSLKAFRKLHKPCKKLKP